MSFFQKNAPHPTLRAWDYVFAQGKSYYIVVTLMNGSKLGGVYSSSSFTSSYPEEPQIFLEKAWIINSDGGFDRERNNSEGILILAKDIQDLEFFTY